MAKRLCFEGNLSEAVQVPSLVVALAIHGRIVVLSVNATQMTLSIRNPEADALARRLAEIDHTSITDAVTVALREAIAARIRKETPSQTAQRILANRGLVFRPDRQPLPQDAYHDLDHDLAGEA
jgi:antitoxin VapB